MEYEPYRIKRKKIAPVGCADRLKSYYKQYITCESGVCDLGNRVVTTSPEVMAALKALLLAGCCRSELTSVAARQIFLRAIESQDHLEVSDLLNTFVSSDPNPFVRTLQDAIREVIE